MSIKSIIKNGNLDKLKSEFDSKLSLPSNIEELAVCAIKNCKYDCFEFITKKAFESIEVNKKKFVLAVIKESAKENKFDIFKKYFIQYKDFLNEEDFHSITENAIRYNRILKFLIEHQSFEKDFFYKFLFELHKRTYSSHFQFNRTVQVKNIELIMNSFKYKPKEYFNYLSDYGLFAHINFNTIWNSNYVFLDFLTSYRNEYFFNNINIFEEYLNEDTKKEFEKHKLAEKLEVF